MVISLFISLKPTFSCQVLINCPSHIVMSPIVLFLRPFRVRANNVADCLVTLRAHSTFGINVGLSNRFCCVFCTFCLILLRKDESLFSLLKLSFIQPRPCFLISLIFSSSRKFPIHQLLFPFLNIFSSSPYSKDTSCFFIFNSFPPDYFQ